MQVQGENANTQPRTQDGPRTFLLCAYSIYQSTYLSMKTQVVEDNAVTH